MPLGLEKWYSRHVKERPASQSEAQTCQPLEVRKVNEFASFAEMARDGALVTIPPVFESTRQEIRFTFAGF